MAHAIERETKRNFDFFVSQADSWVASHAGKFALLRRGGLVEFFDKPNEAAQCALDRFPDGEFSIQRVINRPVDLGFLSYGSGDRPTD